MLGEADAQDWTPPSIGGWSQERFFVAVRCLQDNDDDHPQGELLEITRYDYFCYVTTEPLSPWLAHRTYGQRATSETWIEEAKSQMVRCRRVAYGLGFRENPASSPGEYD